MTPPEEILKQYRASLSDEQREEIFPYGTENSIAVEVVDFVRAISRGRKPEIDGLGGLRAKALCETCYESAAAGKPVRYRDVLDGKVRAYQEPIDDFWKL